MDQLRPFASPTVAGALITGLWAVLSQPLSPGWLASPPHPPAVPGLGFAPPCLAAGLLCQAPGLWHYTVGAFLLGATAVLFFGLGLAAGCALACYVLGRGTAFSFGSASSLEARVIPYRRGGL
jgi:hypothetical protein